MKATVFFALLAQALAAPPDPSNEARGFLVARGETALYQREAELGSSFVFFHVTAGLEMPSLAERHFLREQQLEARRAGLLVGGIHQLDFQIGTGAAQANRFVENGGDWQDDGRSLPGAVLIRYSRFCWGLRESDIRQLISEFFVVYYLLTDRRPILAISRRTWRNCIGNWQDWHELPVDLFDWDVLPTTWPLVYPPPLQTYTFRIVNCLNQGRAQCSCCTRFHGSREELQHYAQAPRQHLRPSLPPAVGPAQSPEISSSSNITAQCTAALIDARNAPTVRALLSTPVCQVQHATADREPQPGTSGYRPPAAKQPKLGPGASEQETQIPRPDPASDPPKEASDSDTALPKDELRRRRKSS